MADNVSSPKKVLAVINKRFPGLWQAVDKVRAEQAADATWPEHVFLPTHIWEDIVRQVIEGEEQCRYANNLCAIGAWRVTQDMVTFDLDFYRELVATDNVTTMKLHKAVAPPARVVHILFFAR